MRMKNFEEISDIKIYLDSASTDEIFEFYRNSREFISGFTTNPTLMKNSGVRDYKAFMKEILSEITDLPISFEVFADDLDEMKNQASVLSGIGPNVFVKIPVTNTKGISTHELVSELNKEGVLCNVTAIMTVEQVKEISGALNYTVPSYISVFAGRISDTGINPIPTIVDILKVLESNKNAEVIWASPRELLNIFQANEIGCHVITATDGILDKLDLIGLDLHTLSLNTVKMFYEDAKKSAFYL